MSVVKAFLGVFLFVIFNVSHEIDTKTNYQVGVGMYDVTGPAAEINMMGYANPAQSSGGIHIRQYSRAFITANQDKSNPVVFVSVDACMVSQLLKLEVIKKLQTEFKGLYTEKNVILSGIHTHSGPAGFHQYVLFEVTSLGFVKESFWALVDGIVMSVKIAHDSMQPGNIYTNEGELLDSNINRSPTAYLNNPKEERAKYKYNVDKNMTVLRFEDAKGKGIGMISWFAVHCTSMNNTNKLISGDNKGYASQLFEKKMNTGQLAGRGSFVAAFAQSNEGDVSPNTRGPHCKDTGLPCDNANSTCNGKNELCIASGPGKDMFESTKIIGENQYKKALELYMNAKEKLEGPVRVIHQYVDMTNVSVSVPSSKGPIKGYTCKPAMGYSFAAGTTDGPGAFDFTQGDTKGNAFWNLVRNFLKKPSADLVKCQSPKPILLATGEMSFPYPWQPHIVDLQMATIGHFAILAVPGEFSTMSGRRLRDAALKVLTSEGFPKNTHAVVAGLSNTYSDYITTYEEYQIQRYEGASTIFGPFTHGAYVQKFQELSLALAKGKTLPGGPTPPDLLDKQHSFVLPVVVDRHPLEKKFGDVLVDAQNSYHKGDTVSVEFVSGHPRNNLQTNATFLTVEQKQVDKSWKVIYEDSAWETRYEWVRTSTVLAESKSVIRWDIPVNQASGTYRIRHFGHSKSLLGKISPYQGSSKAFIVQ